MIVGRLVGLEGWNVGLKVGDTDGANVGGVQAGTVPKFLFSIDDKHGA